MYGAGQADPTNGGTFLSVIALSIVVFVVIAIIANYYDKKNEK